jgi:hypothetical protein
MLAAKYNKREYEEGRLTDEHVVELVKAWQEDHELEVDGMAGSLTRSTIDALLVPGVVQAGGWQPWDGPEIEQPCNRKEAYAFFGNPGAGTVNKAWVYENIVECHGKTQLPGVPAKWYVKIHQLVEPYLREGLRRARLAAPEYRIERLGGFVFRHIRHDKSRPLSMHAFGCAVDIDPKKNFSRRFKKGEAPEAWSPEWMEIWPDGLPRAFVEAMQSCGFAWGSDWDEDGLSSDHTYLDSQHFEWIARDGIASLV